MAEELDFKELQMLAGEILGVDPERVQMELAGRSLKRQLGHADTLGARYVAIVENGETVLRDMQQGGQERLATDTVVHAVLRGRRTL